MKIVDCFNFCVGSTQGMKSGNSQFEYERMLRAHSKITLHFGSRFILSACALETRHMLDMTWFPGLGGQATQFPKLVINF
jgi:hypothetical protein